LRVLWQWSTIKFLDERQIMQKGYFAKKASRRSLVNPGILVLVFRFSPPERDTIFGGGGGGLVRVLRNTTKSLLLVISPFLTVTYCRFTMMTSLPISYGTTTQDFFQNNSRAATAIPRRKPPSGGGLIFPELSMT
jgi:hypothetical protein